MLGVLAGVRICINGGGVPYSRRSVFGVHLSGQTDTNRRTDRRADAQRDGGNITGGAIIDRGIAMTCAEVDGRRERCLQPCIRGLLRPSEKKSRSLFSCRVM